MTDKTKIIKIPTNKYNFECLKGHKWTCSFSKNYGRKLDYCVQCKEEGITTLENLYSPVQKTENDI